MSCSLTADLIDARLLQGELAAAQDEHLAGCERCRRALDELDALGAAVRAVSAPTGFAAGVMARLPERPAPSPRAPAAGALKAAEPTRKAISGRQLHRRRGRTRLGLSAIAAFALCGAAVWSLTPRPEEPAAPTARSESPAASAAPKPAPRIELPRIDLGGEPAQTVGAQARRVLAPATASSGATRDKAGAGPEAPGAEPAGPVLPAVKKAKPAGGEAASEPVKPKLPPPPEPKDEIDDQFIFAWDYRLGSLDPTGIARRDDLLARFIARAFFQSSFEADRSLSGSRALLRELSPAELLGPKKKILARAEAIVAKKRRSWVIETIDSEYWTLPSGQIEHMPRSDITGLWKRRGEPPRRAEHPLYDGVHPRYLRFLGRLRGAFKLEESGPTGYALTAVNPTSWLTMRRILYGAPFLITREPDPRGEPAELIASGPWRLKVIRGEDGFVRELRIELCYNGDVVAERVRFVAVDLDAIDPEDYDDIVSLPPEPSRGRLAVTIDAQSRLERQAAAFVVARVRHAVARRTLALAGASSSYRKLLDFPDTALTTFDDMLIAASRLTFAVGYENRSLRRTADALMEELAELGFSATLAGVARKASKDRVALIVKERRRKLSPSIQNSSVELVRFAAQERPITDSYLGSDAFDDRGYLLYPPRLSTRSIETLDDARRALADNKR